MATEITRDDLKQAAKDIIKENKDDLIDKGKELTIDKLGDFIGDKFGDTLEEWGMSDDTVKTMIGYFANGTFKDGSIMSQVDTIYDIVKDAPGFSWLTDTEAFKSIDKFKGVYDTFKESVGTLVKNVKAVNEIENKASTDYQDLLVDSMYAFLDFTSTAMGYVPVIGDIVDKAIGSLKSILEDFIPQYTEAVNKRAVAYYLDIVTECNEIDNDRFDYTINKINIWGEPKASWANGMTLEELATLSKLDDSKIGYFNKYIEWRFDYEAKAAIEKMESDIERDWLYQLKLTSRKKGNSSGETFNERMRERRKVDTPAPVDPGSSTNVDKPSSGSGTTSGSGYDHKYNYGGHTIDTSYADKVIGGTQYGNPIPYYVPTSSMPDLVKLDGTAQEFLDMFLEYLDEDPEAAWEDYRNYMRELKGDGEESEDLADEIDDLVKETLGDAYEGYEDAGEAAPPRDPLIFDLDGDGDVKLTSVDEGAHFDIDKNGFAELTAWTQGKDGFLAMDRNHNNRIDDGGELFSDYVVKKDGSIAKNGFDALKDLDDNVVDEKTGKVGDNWIDEKDSAYNDLLVWVDANGDGISQANELKTLKEAGIAAIEIPEDIDGTPDSDKKTATVIRTGGRKNTTISEHWFDINTHDTQERDETGKPIVANSVNTFGNVKNLTSAIKDDETGVLAGLVDEFKASGDYAEKRVLIKKILFFITGSNDIQLGSRGGSIDERELNVIEKFMGSDFKGVDGSSSPNSVAGPMLKTVYNKIENMYFNLLNNETEVGNYTRTAFLRKDENGNKTLDISMFEYLIVSKMLKGENVDNAVYGIASWLKQYDDANGTKELENFTKEFSSITDKFADIPTMVNLADVKFGGEGNDSFNGGSGAELFWGDGGNDTINAGAGNDQLYGGEGNDTLNGGDGDDRLYGGEGDDILNGGNGNDIYYFGKNQGNDIVRDTEGDNKIVFTDGISINDYEMAIDAKLGFVLTHKETGETVSLPDFLRNPLNYDFVSISDGTNQISSSNKNIVNGTDDDDYFKAVDDVMNVIYGGAGDDTFEGGTGMDFMYGGAGNDIIDGKGGINVLFGEDGDDKIYDGDEGSYLNGGDGNDELYGGNGSNVLIGGKGDDIIYDGGDASYLEGGDGDDQLYGGGGADVLDGGAGNDYLQGDHGGDTYIFGKGYDCDTINASSDDNTIIIKGYRESDMIKTRNQHGDLIIHFGSKDSKDCLIVDHFFDYNSNRDINFVFEAEGGKVVGQYDIKNVKYEPIVGSNDSDWLGIYTDESLEYHGLAGHDGIGAGNGNDILDGGSGNDTLMGGNGTDTYIFARGYDHDTINEWGNDKSIIKLYDICSDDVTFELNGGNLDMIVNDTEDILTISGFQWGQGTYEFHFADLLIGNVDKETLEFKATPESIAFRDEVLAKAAEAEANGEEFEFDYDLGFNEKYFAMDTGLTDFSDIKLTPPQIKLLSDAENIIDSELSDMTSRQVLSLVDNMAAFSAESSVFDSMNIDMTADTTAANQLLISNSID